MDHLFRVLYTHVNNKLYLKKYSELKMHIKIGIKLEKSGFVEWKYDTSNLLSCNFNAQGDGSKLFKS